MTDLPEVERPPGGPTPVDVVVDALDKRLVGPVDRGRLRDAIDRADAPLGGRAGADAAVGRVTG